MSFKRHTTHQKHNQDNVGEGGGEVHHLKTHTHTTVVTHQSLLSTEKGGAGKESPRDTYSYADTSSDYWLQPRLPIATLHERTLTQVSTNRA